MTSSTSVGFRSAEAVVSLTKLLVGVTTGYDVTEPKPKPETEPKTGRLSVLDTTTSVSAHHDRIHRVGVGETPGGGHVDYIASDATENDVNSRRLEVLQNNVGGVTSSTQGSSSKHSQTTTTAKTTTTTKFEFSFHLPGRGRGKDRGGNGGGGRKDQARTTAGRAASSAHRHERRATKTLAIVLGVFLFCWVPFFTLNIINATCIRYDLFTMSGVCRFDPILFSFFVWLGYINSFLNPVIYTIFNDEFRRVFKRLLCFSHK